MPFVKGQSGNMMGVRYNQKPKTPDFVAFVCELYADGADLSHISNLTGIQKGKLNRYIKGKVEWFRNLCEYSFDELHAKRLAARLKYPSALVDFNKTKKENASKFLSLSSARYYVYIHKDAVGQVFYVGKGTGDRHKSSGGRSGAWKLRAQRGFTSEIFRDNLTETDAIRLETFLITSPPTGWELVNKWVSDNKLNYSDTRWEDIFYYDETSPSGLRWKIHNGQSNHSARTSGDVAGYVNTTKHGCRWKVAYKGREYLAHRIIYQMFYGNIDCDLIINHIDNNPKNNTISNLEMITQAENTRRSKIQTSGNLSSNNTSGVTGFRETVGEYGVFAHIFYKDVLGVTRSKKFSHTLYGKEVANTLAKDYLNQMKKLVEDERARLLGIRENEHAVC